jgi:hypothetical protein
VNFFSGLEIGHAIYSNEAPLSGHTSIMKVRLRADSGIGEQSIEEIFVGECLWKKMPLTMLFCKGAEAAAWFLVFLKSCMY